MDAQERVYGYTGASGLIVAFAVGYFVWDLMITLQHLRMFGVGMLFHAVSALCVYSLGFVSAPSQLRILFLVETQILTGITATLCQLLRAHLHSLRTLVALSQHSLVL